jgi:hypothetical protein
VSPQALTATLESVFLKNMKTQYKMGPVYRAGLIVCGGMCAGLAVAVLVASALHRQVFAHVLTISLPTEPTSSVGFLLCGLALIGIGYWFPHVTLLFGTVSMSLAVVVMGESLFNTGPRMEHHIAVSLGMLDWHGLAPNTVVVLLLGGAALLLRHTGEWFENRLHIIALIGSVIVAIGTSGCVGYMAGVPTYAWYSKTPMSFVSVICAFVLGLGIVMSACRYSELDESGTPRWFPLVVFVGALAVNCSTGIAYLFGDSRIWQWPALTGLLPMTAATLVLSAMAARDVRRWREQRY